MNENQPRLAADICYGADEIAEELFGAKKHRRRVYHLAAAGQLPVFRLGDIICARRSSLRTHVAELEAAGRAAA